MLPRFNHQEKANELLWANGVFALIMEQGTGKSRPIIDDWLARIDYGNAQDLVVLAPKGCYMNWIGTEGEPGELMKWVPPERLPTLNIVPWRTDLAAHRRALDNLLRATGPRFLVMNIEALNRVGLAREYLLVFCDGRRVIGTIDESTTICHEDAQRTQFILDHFAPRLIARRILSGLVAPESPMDLYTQYCFLDWQIIGQRSYFGFRNRYAIMNKIDFRPMSERVSDFKAGKKGRPAQVLVGYRNLE